MLVNDLAHEMVAVKGYNAGIELAGKVADFATRELLEKILKDEDGHVDGIEEMQDQIGHMTLPLFLTTQL